MAEQRQQSSHGAFARAVFLTKIQDRVLLDMQVRKGFGACNLCASVFAQRSLTLPSAHFAADRRVY